MRTLRPFSSTTARSAWRSATVTFPASFVAKMRELLAQAPTDPQAEQQQQVAMQTAVAKIQDLTAGANLKQAKAERESALIQHDHIDGFAKVAAMAAPPAQPAGPLLA